MSNSKFVSLAAAVGFVLGAALAAAQPAASSNLNLRGTVMSSDGKPLEGVAVSARQNGKTYTTSVYTDEQGKYVFPPLESGHYRIWAQAIGFETARAELDSATQARQDFTFKPYKDFFRQLSGTEWMASLPEDTPENRRMKSIFRNNCAGCHQPNFVLQNRFDEAGWRKIITIMEKEGIYGEPPRADLAPLPLLRVFKDELAAYLAKIRGPVTFPLKFKQFPRPRGESAQVVITEYDLTSNVNPDEFVTQNGSDWMEGVPSAYEARGPHDIEIDPNGIAWISDSQSSTVRTVLRLDPNTGQTKNFKLAGRRGLAKRGHGIIIDHKGIAWFNADGVLGKLDTKTEKLESFAPSKEMNRVGGTLDVDSQGRVCASTEEGVIRFDPNTEKFTELKSVSRGNEGRSYGVAVDAEGNCWWAQMDYSTLGKSDIRTGKSVEVVLQPRPGWDENVTPHDRKFYNFTGADWNSAAPWHQGSRRLSADKKGNTIWVADSWGDNLAKIDIKTNKVLAYYQVPLPGFSLPYSTVVDRNGMVWTNLSNADRIARFDPKTEKWTIYPLPSIGTETRFIAVDDRKSPVEVWTVYWRTSRAARVQFRTKEQLQARQ